MSGSLGPSRWKRLLYSILSVILIALMASVVASTGLLMGLRHFNPALFLMETLVMWLFILVACLPGWLLALPAIWSVTNFRRWRFLIFWAIGTAIGPLVLFGMSQFPISQITFSARKGSFWAAITIACLVTLLYILLVRYDQRRARLRAGAIHSS